jgi:CheY-like chemotaxis protein
MRVLLAEDENDIRNFLTRALPFLIPGAKVLALVDGRAALEAFNASHFDMVVSDHQMPRMTGLELLGAVRAQASTPFIVLSADQSIGPAAIAAGASCFLDKPITLEELRKALYNVILPLIGYTERYASGK